MTGGPLPQGALRLELPEGAVLSLPVETPATLSPDWLAARIEALSPWEPEACLADLQPGRLGLLPLSALPPGALVEIAAGPFTFRRDEAFLNRWRERLLALACGIALLATLAAWGGWNAWQAAADRAAEAGAALERSSARLAAGEAAGQRALELAHRRGVGPLLQALAADLPDDSYLTTLALQGGGLTVSGVSRAPQGLVPALARDPLWQGVDFAGPLARDGDAGWLFTLHATVAP